MFDVPLPITTPAANYEIPLGIVQDRIVCARAITERIGRSLQVGWIGRDVREDIDEDHPAER